MSDFAASIIAFICGLAIAGALMFALVNEKWERDSVVKGKAEYYIDPTTFQKVWRWKE